MKLMNDFFEIIKSTEIENGFISTIQFNPNHIVYKGHFPGHPVTPGVIQMQIVHELLEQHLNQKLKLKKMPQCKFLKILNPNETKQIDVNIQFKEIENEVKLKTIGSNGNDTFFKFNSVLIFSNI